MGDTTNQGHVQRHRPMVLLALAMGAGIVASRVLSPSADVLFLISLLSILLLPIALRSRSRTSQHVVLLVLVALCGALNYYWHFTSHPQNHISNIALPNNRAITQMTGIVIREPAITLRSKPFWHDREAFRTVLLIEAESLEGNLIRKNVSGRVDVTVYDRAEDVRYGDRVRISGHMMPPRPRENPGSFDYEKYMKRRHVYAKLISNNADNINILERNNGNAIKLWVYALRRSVRRSMKKYLGESEAALVNGLLLGDAGGISSDKMEEFRKAGAAHFLAVSGLHMGIVATFLWIVLRLLRVNTKAAALVVIIFACMYAVLTGGRIPVIRAGIIVCVISGAILAGRKHDLLNNLAAAAFIILLLWPGEIFDVGFQLSFAAVTGIVLLANSLHSTLFGKQLFFEQLQSAEERSLVGYYIWRYCRSMLTVSAAAWLFVFPIIANVFHTISPIAIPLSVLMFPLVWLVLILGFVMAFVAFAFSWFAPVFGGVLTASAKVIYGLVHFAAEMPWSFSYTAGFSASWLVLYYALLAAVVFREKLRLRLSHIAIMVLAFGNIYIYSDIFAATPAKLEVTWIDVGGGLSVFVEFPDGKTLLYDTGSYSTNQVGGRIIAPFLWSRGVTRLDAIILSHSHSDHCNGLLDVMDRFPVGQVMFNDSFDNTRTGKEIIRELNRRNASYTMLAAGDRIVGLSEQPIRVLNPVANSTSDLKYLNDLSTVLLLESGGAKVMLCGDIEERGIYHVLRALGQYKLTALQVPHHGGWAGNNNFLTSYLRPDFALVSGGRNSLVPEVRDQYLRAGSILFTTTESGALTLTAKEGEVNVATQLSVPH